MQDGAHELDAMFFWSSSPTTVLVGLEKQETVDFIEDHSESRGRKRLHSSLQELLKLYVLFFRALLIGNKNL